MDVGSIVEQRGGCEPMKVEPVVEGYAGCQLGISIIWRASGGMAVHADAGWEWEWECDGSCEAGDGFDLFGVTFGDVWLERTMDLHSASQCLQVATILNGHLATPIDSSTETYCSNSAFSSLSSLLPDSELIEIGCTPRYGARGQSPQGTPERS